MRKVQVVVAELVFPFAAAHAIVATINKIFIAQITEQLSWFKEANLMPTNSRHSVDTTPCIQRMTVVSKEEIWRHE